jgi:IMP cyclohydrolase
VNSGALAFVIGDTCSVNMLTNPVISYECDKDREVLTTNGTYPWSFVTQILHSGRPNRGGDRERFQVMTST